MVKINIEPKSRHRNWTVNDARGLVDALDVNLEADMIGKYVEKFLRKD